MNLATIEKIHSIQKHPNEEVTSLEVAKIKEWPVVVKKGQFTNGDLVVFIRIDSICPKENPYFAFLERQKYRIWNAKFKGSPSQGLVCPLTILPIKVGDIITPALDGNGIAVFEEKQGYIEYSKYKEGDDVSEVLGIIKYEKPLDATICGDAKGGFPTHLVSITDEDNLLNSPDTLKEFLNEECYVTIKADGSSMTVYYMNGEVGVCSRRWEQKEGTGLWKIAGDLPDKLRALKMNVAIQAEACGGKIQGNPMGLAAPGYFVFNVKDLSTGKWYGYYEIKNFCEGLGIPMVRLMPHACSGFGDIGPFVIDEVFTIQTLQNLANNATYTTSKGEVKKAEGIVLRPTTPKFSPTLGKSLSVKILNQEYKG